MIGLEELAELRSAAVALAGALDPSMASGFEAAVVIEHAVAIKNIAGFVESTYGARVAETDVWKKDGARSPAEWLSNRAGTTTSAASERIKAGQRLHNQPRVKEAAARGDLSDEQTAAVTDAVDADPDAEERLIGQAKRGSLRDLRDERDRTKAAADPDPDATHRRIKAERSLRFWSQAGVARMFANTTPEQMAVIRAAVEARADQLFHAARKAGDPQPPEHYLMDALEQICAHYLGATLDGDDTDVDHTSAEHDKANGDASEPPPPAPKPKAKPIFLGLIRVDHAALVRGHTEGDELCEIAGLGPIPVAVARELLGEALLYVILTKGTAVANVINIKRGPTVAQRMALLWRSPFCAIKACNRIHVERDHTRPWATTKLTLLDDLEHLCDHHHDLKSHHGWDVITDGDGDRIMVAPDDPLHPGHAPPGDDLDPATTANPDRDDGQTSDAA